LEMETTMCRKDRFSDCGDFSNSIDIGSRSGMINCGIVYLIQFLNFEFHLDTVKSTMVCDSYTSNPNPKMKFFDLFYSLFKNR
jgi:hypothetical protein